MKILNANEILKTPEIDNISLIDSQTKKKQMLKVAATNLMLNKLSRRLLIANILIF